MGRLAVLMYHNVSENDSDSKALTISTTKLEMQLDYLKRKNYKSIFASEIEKIDNSLTKNVCLTFDDVTQNQLLFALPLLQKYNIKATFYIPFSYIGKSDLWNKSENYKPKKIMTFDELKSINSDLIEFGYHSFFHQKYEDLSEIEIQDDFERSNEIIKKNNLDVKQTLAYPYGNFPKELHKNQLFIKILEKNNIKLAFRIGNRINRLPLKNKFEIQRIDVRGNESLLYFSWKLNFGKLRLF
jgi:peptidoglycan/xylan/chitin deacetylase (PgdA/CDA1 family)